MGRSWASPTPRTAPEAVAIKNAGQLVGDREVIALLLEELLHPRYRDGVIVDGFPRTEVQVEFLKLFYHALLGLNSGGASIVFASRWYFLIS